MKISVIGLGYVGLTTAVCLASKNHTVLCVDRDEEKIDRVRRGDPTIYEEGMEELLRSALKKEDFSVDLDLAGAVKKSEVSLICVGTPSKEDGSIDLSQVEAVSKDLGRALSMRDGYHVVTLRSTVIPGTTEDIVIPILETSSGKRAGVDFGVCMNPEFLREGRAIRDFLSPADLGIVIGELDERSGDVLAELYGDFEAEVLRTSIRTAEMIKYARNSYLAKDVSFANEIASLCERMGVDYLEVKRGMEMDGRIGRGRFLSAGVGFGGSCLPKDVSALIVKARELGCEPRLLEATLKNNDMQPYRMLELAKRALRSVRGKRIAILGLAFKPYTDDVREAPSIKVIESFLEEGTSLTAHDPRAMSNARRLLGDKITYAGTPEEALRDADACLIVTEWPEFSAAHLYESMKGNVIIDGRRILDPQKLSSRFVYHGIGYGGR